MAVAMRGSSALDFIEIHEDAGFRSKGKCEFEWFQKDQ